MIISDRKIRYRKHIVSGLGLRLEIRMERLCIKAIRCLNLDHMLNRFLLGMRHRYLRRFIFETVHHALQTGDLLLLRIVILHELAVIFLLALHEVCVISRIARRRTILDLINHINNVIKEHSVMRYNNDSLRITLEITLEPFDRCDIQVVGRLVEKQDIRLA